ncbi:type III pantothenate kinase [Roseimicrobium gellanilyticum]|uniref:Type III pantothenate kinase n=1 Tax=Roseimicrobium gellanilyticum TaxID=748857 RepID=A0A366HDL2_9BACT|nr:type III pantothenate kinase [Roseimicrobium gellanilyticum]RBP39704.1 type III pantothenate kinase [Roseimicrobium gellanilyticum]
MPQDYLLIDVGNGRTKFGLASRTEIQEQRDLPTAGLAPAELAEALDGWKYDRVVTSSVVPAATEKLKSYFENMLVLRHDIPLGIGITYPRPETIGADRLANAVALAHLYSAPGIVIDFGTAVTFDIVDASASYVGGVIAPGLRLMTDYLHERTALLPQVDLHEPTHAIGKSTVEAILSGAAHGYRGMVRGILEALRREMGNPTGLRVVATGGDAAWIASALPEIERVDEDLTLHGLRLVGNLHPLS